MLIDLKMWFVCRKSLKSQAKLLLQILKLRSIQNHTIKTLDSFYLRMRDFSGLHGKIQIPVLRMFMLKSRTILVFINTVLPGMQSYDVKHTDDVSTSIKLASNSDRKIIIGELLFKAFELKLAAI